MTGTDSKILRRSLFRLAVATGLLLGGGLAVLQHFVLTLPPAEPIGSAAQAGPDTGIVVATGGGARIEAGLELLEKTAASRMLVTGVGAGISRQILADELALSKRGQQLFDCCVDLDFEAQDTRGNATAAQRWATRHQLDQLLLVTASYHLPRALLEFQRRLPETQLAVYPVMPPDLEISSWYYEWQTARLLSREFSKYMLVRLGLG
jgi:uncharacterized SAM-binding protein YcdF (DUF218 family)